MRNMLWGDILHLENKPIWNYTDPTCYFLYAWPRDGDWRYFLNRMCIDLGLGP